ncbi:hypothetical protein B0H10DRAFT_2221885 [Mycena sp. CBHHK59/15]|nr:hypothetical protein B0H10DRAFT_2221885 [Mycena sp. CBHHK59/15]
MDQDVANEESITLPRNRYNVRSQFVSPEEQARVFDPQYNNQYGDPLEFNNLNDVNLNQDGEDNEGEVGSEVDGNNAPGPSCASSGQGGGPRQLPYGGHQGQDDHNSQQDGNSQHAGQYRLSLLRAHPTGRGTTALSSVTAVTAVNSAMAVTKDRTTTIVNTMATPSTSGNLAIIARLKMESTVVSKAIVLKDTSVKRIIMRVASVLESFRIKNTILLTMLQSASAMKKIAVGLMLVSTNFKGRLAIVDDDSAIQSSRTNSEDEDEGEKSDDEGEDGTEKRKRAPRTAREPEPTNLNFYPSHWRDVLEAAKWAHRLHLISVHFFPEKKCHVNGECLEILTTAINDAEDNDIELEPSYYKLHKTSMQLLIWNEATTFRSKGKGFASAIVRTKYRIFPSPEDFEGGFNQEEWQEHTVANVEKLREDGFFLTDGLDHSGKTKNLAHPALFELLHQWLFGFSGKKGKRKTECLAKVYPNEFEAFRREHIAAAGTLLLACIDEYETGVHVATDFTQNQYEETYECMREIIDVGLADPDHGPRIRRTWNSWILAIAAESGKAKKTPRSLHLGIRLD